MILIISYNYVTQQSRVALHKYMNYEFNLPENYSQNTTSSTTHSATSTNKILPDQPTIFCIILTSENNIKTKAETVYKAWARKCDNYTFVIKRNGSATLDSTLNILEPPGLVADTYDKLTDKVLLTIKYLHESVKQYDWYLKADDDTMIFVDNLRAFVATKNKTDPVTYGYNFKTIVERGYHSGGGGYVLSEEAFNRLGVEVRKNFSFCENTGTEDVDVAKCLRKLKVYPGSSLDQHGRERFHPLSIEHHYTGYFPDWLIWYASNPVKKVSSLSFFNAKHLNSLNYNIITYSSNSIGR